MNYYEPKIKKSNGIISTFSHKYIYNILIILNYFFKDYFKR